jgi:hypothetical protein
MITICGELHETARVDEAKKRPSRALFVKDRMFFLISDTSIDNGNLAKPLAHSDIKGIYMIKGQQGMKLVDVDEYLKSLS